MLKNISRRKKKLMLGVTFLILAALAVAAFLISSRIERDHDAVPEGAGEAPHRHIGDKTASSTAESSGMEDGEHATVYYNGQKYIYHEDLSTLLILLYQSLVCENSSFFLDFTTSCLFLVLPRWLSG